MSTEIVKHQSSQVPSFNFFDAEQFAVMQRVCTMFASSELVPDMYRTSEKNPKEKAIANCMIAIETAQRIGASPLMVMQNMYIVYGRPSWSAKFLTATVNACGRFAPMKYRLTPLGKVKNGNFGEVEDWECVAYTTEKGTNQVLESIPVTISMAIAEGWYNKNGSKWKTMPKLMLQYRSVTYWTSAYAPELSMGIQTKEEVEDYIDYEEVKPDPAAAAKAEINANGNKTSIGITEEPPADGPPANTGHAPAPSTGSADTGNKTAPPQQPSSGVQQKAPF